MIRAVVLLVALSGCCAEPVIPSLPPAPMLPAGEPESDDDRIAALIHSWDGPEDGPWEVPARDIQVILKSRDRWRSFAKALKAAGRWRERPKAAVPPVAPPPPKEF